MRRRGTERKSGSRSRSQSPMKQQQPKQGQGFPDKKSPERHITRRFPAKVVNAKTLMDEEREYEQRIADMEISKQRSEGRYRSGLDLYSRVKTDYQNELSLPWEPNTIMFPVENPDSSAVSVMRRTMSRLQHNFVQIFGHASDTLTSESELIAAKEQEAARLKKKLLERAGELEELEALNEVMGGYLLKLRQLAGPEGMTVELPVSPWVLAKTDHAVLSEFSSPGTLGSVGSFDRIDGLESHTSVTESSVGGSPSLGNTSISGRSTSHGDRVHNFIPSTSSAPSLSAAPSVHSVRSYKSSAASSSHYSLSPPDATDFRSRVEGGMSSDRDTDTDSSRSPPSIVGTVRSSHTYDSPESITSRASRISNTPKVRAIQAEFNQRLASLIAAHDLAHELPSGSSTHAGTDVAGAGAPRGRTGPNPPKRAPPPPRRQAPPPPPPSVSSSSSRERSRSRSRNNERRTGSPTRVPFSGSHVDSGTRNGGQAEQTKLEYAPERATEILSGDGRHHESEDDDNDIFGDNFNMWGHDEGQEPHGQRVDQEGLYEEVVPEKSTPKSPLPPPPAHLIPNNPARSPTEQGNKTTSVIEQLALHDDDDEEEIDSQSNTSGDNDSDENDGAGNMSFDEAMDAAKSNMSILKTVLGSKFGGGTSPMKHMKDDQLSQRENAKQCRRALQTMALSKKYAQLRPAEVLKAITAIAESVQAADYAKSRARTKSSRDSQGNRRREKFQRSRVTTGSVALLAEFLDVEIPVNQMMGVAKFLSDVDPSGVHHCRMLSRLISMTGVEGHGKEVIKAGKLVYVAHPTDSGQHHEDSLALHDNEDVILIAEKQEYMGDTWGPENRHTRIQRELEWNQRFAKHNKKLETKFKEKKEKQREEEWGRLNCGGWKVVRDGSNRPINEQMGLPPLPVHVHKILAHLVRYNTLHYIPIFNVTQKLSRAFAYGEMDTQAEVRTALKAAGMCDASLADGRKVGEYLKQVRKHRDATMGGTVFEQPTTLEGLSLQDMMRLEDGGSVPELDVDGNGAHSVAKSIGSSKTARANAIARAEVMLCSDLVLAMQLVATTGVDAIKGKSRS